LEFAVLSGRASLSLLAILILTAPAAAKTLGPRADVNAGREFALQACTGCHIVAAHQEFAPLLTGAPTFEEIANRSNVSTASLRRAISAMPQVPSRGRMANPLLTDNDLADVAAYIMTLRESNARR
jgi:mono/diheme cytochrome c family protein